MCYMAKSENARRHHAAHVVIGALGGTSSLSRSRSLFFPHRVSRKRLLLRNRPHDRGVTSHLGFHPVEKSRVARS